MVIDNLSLEKLAIRNQLHVLVTGYLTLEKLVT